MKLSPRVFNARSPGASVLDIKMTSTSSFVTKPKPRRGGLAGLSIARRSSFILNRETVTKLTVLLWPQEVAAMVKLYLVSSHPPLALFQARSLCLLKCKPFTIFFQTTCSYLILGLLEAISAMFYPSSRERHLEPNFRRLSLPLLWHRLPKGQAQAVYLLGRIRTIRKLYIV